MDKKEPLYPLKFKPILKEKVWGGTKLTNLFDKKGKGNIGESWELSGVDGNISIVANGKLKDQSLTSLIDTYKEDLVGEDVYKNFGNQFPLLFKFIDAREDLSVQLHPNDNLAKEMHDSFGKTEMWYIMQADKEARLILGFNRKMDEATYLKYLSEKNIIEILHSEKVAAGDAFFIAPGTVHAIGAGVVLAEIQQTSDITYRIYDWDRPDTNGEFRELHTDLALKAINYKRTNLKIDYCDLENEPVLLKSLPYFETNKLHLTSDLTKKITNQNTFIVYMCVEGEATLNSVSIKKGETLLIPANTKDLNFKTEGAIFLEVYIP